MTKKVKAAVLIEKSKIEIQEFCKPDINNDDGLLKIEMAGVCGTDPNFFSGKVKVADLPIILGHEILGHIAAVGNLASKRWNVKEGDRVIVEAVFRCGYCQKCVTGDYRFCEKNLGYGTTISSSLPPHLWGAYAEYMYLAPGSIIHKISSGIPAGAAVLVNAVLSNAIRWGRISGRFCISDAVVIQGAGQQGLALTIVAKESGCNPIIVTGLSKDKKRFELAKQFGANYLIDVEEDNLIQRVTQITDGNMADVVVDVAGNSKATISSIEILKPQGILVLPTIMGNKVLTPIALDKIVWKDINIIGQFTSDSRTMNRAIKLVELKRYRIENIVSHSFTLEEAEKAVKTAGGFYENIYATKCVIQP
jgi:alcohol dehydrogenase